MRVGFTGSRDYPRLDLVENFVLAMARKYADGPEPLVVVSGGARGVDKKAEDTAVMCGLDVWSYRPTDDHIGLWVSTNGSFFFETGRTYGQGSYVRNLFARNDSIARCDKVVAFWNLRSTGTADTISKAKGHGSDLFVYGDDGMLMDPEILRVCLDAVLG